MKKTLTLASGSLLLALAFSWWWTSRQPSPVELIPTLTGQPDTASLAMRTFPRSARHIQRHLWMCDLSWRGTSRPECGHGSQHHARRCNPSDLSVSGISCGGSNCHSGSEADSRNHIQRVMTSVQSTYAGAIGNILFLWRAIRFDPTFGDQCSNRRRYPNGITRSLPWIY